MSLHRAIPCIVLGLCLGAGATNPPRLPAEWRSVARDVFRELIEIDTTHEQGATSAARALEARLRKAGFGDGDLFVGGPAPKKQNLVARLRGTGKRRPVLFVVHLDVVAALRADWTLEPFKFTEQGGFFYGRGTEDIKDEAADLAVMLLRLKQEGHHPDRDVIVAFTDDEEAGGPANGVDWLLRNHRELVDASIAINPDASSGETVSGKRRLLELETSEKVYLSFRLRAVDRGGHSSKPHAGNPIGRIAGALARIGAFEFPVHLDATTRGFFATMARQEHDPLAADLARLGTEPLDAQAAARVAQSSEYYAALMHTTCVATQIVGGHAENALPQSAEATVNCRILPTESADATEAELRTLIADPEVAISRIDPAQPSPPSALVPGILTPFTRAMHTMFPGVEMVPMMATGASDSVFLRNAGIPTYGVSGMFEDVDDDRSHGRDERIGVEDFYDGVEFMYRFAKEITAPR